MPSRVCREIDVRYKGQVLSTSLGSLAGECQDTPSSAATTRGPRGFGAEAHAQAALDLALHHDFEFSFAHATVSHGWAAARSGGANKGSTRYGWNATMLKKLKPMHPSEVLPEEFLLRLEMSAGALAEACSLSRARTEPIANEQTGITADTALRFAKALGTTAQLRLNRQTTMTFRSPSAISARFSIASRP